MKTIFLVLLRLVALPLTNQFSKSLKSPQRAQNRLKDGIARRMSRTEYGKSLSLSKGDDFRDALPIVDYDTLAQWVEKQKESEGAILVPESVRMYEKTSGSSGPAKYIPYTRRIQWSFTKMFLLWAANVASHVKGLGSGAFYFSVSPSFGNSERTDQGKRVGLEDDRDYLSGPIRWLVNPFFVPQPSPSDMRDPERFKTAIARSLLSADDLESISVWNPSFLMILLDWIREHRQLLLAEPNVVCSKDRREALLEDEIQWSRVWPKLRFISCWADANAKPLAQELRRCFPTAFVQGKGLLATEAPMTIPWCGVVGGVPLVDDVYFEFETNDGQILELHEIIEGQEYGVIITQCAGLCRYRMGDLVRVVGRIHQTPTLEFVGRGNSVSDLVGEKLNERFVAGALERVLTGHSRFKQLLASRTDGDRYLLVVDQLEENTDIGDIERRIEDALREAHHYDHARSLGQLGPVILVVDPKVPELMAQFYQRQGMKLGDVKQSYLGSRPTDSTLMEALGLI